ncbi:MAG: hypothetical protein ACI810_002751 [Gammaproteobacteria bacterium]|jgi:hypothetical protein
MKKAALALCFSVALLVALTFFLSFTSTGYGLLNWFDNQRQGDPAIPASVETVMPANSTITATTEASEITIIAGSGLKRSYHWEGANRSVVMFLVTNAGLVV